MNTRAVKITFILMLLFLVIIPIITAEDGSEDDAEIIESKYVQFFPVKQPTNLSHRSYDQSDLFCGSSNYHYDLIIPPGTANMAPDLKLVYCSDYSNSWLGVGWNLEGFSYIERSTRMGSPNYDNNDTFVLNLNGVDYELVRESGGHYRTKIESWIKLYFNDTSWSLSTRDGKTYIFGSNTSSRIPIVGHSHIRRWAVDRILDKDGNYISYSYYLDASNGEYYPNTIEYTHNTNATLSKVKKIQFSRESRNDNVAPEARWMKYRIKEMKVTIDGILVEKYTFLYKYSKTTNNSLLSAVNRYGSGSIPETQTMTYKSDAGSLGWNWASTIKLPDAIYLPYRNSPFISQTQISFGDINGDGLVDYTEKEFREDKFWCYTNNGTRFNALSMGNIYNASGKVVKIEGMIFKDINGDGLDDVFSGTTAYINRGDNSRWQADTIWSPAFIKPSSVEHLIIDANCDSVLDNLTFGFSKISSSSGWSSGSSYNLPYGNTSLIYIPCDLNGDGWIDLNPIYDNYSVFLNDRSGKWIKTDLWKRTSSNQQFYAVNFNDFNGDGLTDYVSKDGMYLNTSYGWQKRTEWNYADYCQYDYEVEQYIDINNDGILDIINRTMNNVANETINYVQLKLPNGSNGPKISINKKGVFLYVNDDPFPDFLSFEDNTIYMFNAKPDLLSSVTTKNGATISLEYARLPIDHYLSSGLKRGAPFRKYVVTKVTTNEGTGRTDSSFTTSYSYSSRGKYQRSERTFLGFSWVKKTYPNGDTEKINFSQNIKTAGRIVSVEENSKNTKIVQTNNWKVTDLSSLRYKVLLNDMVISVNGSISSKSKTTYNYDDYGNIIVENRLGEVDVSGDEVTYKKQYINDTSKWLIGYPFQEKVVDASGNVIADKLIWYDKCSLGNIEKGHISEEKMWLDKFNNNSCSNNYFYSLNSFRPVEDLEDLHPLTKYTYDSFGNIISIRTHNIGPEGSIDQSLSIQFDSLAHCLPEKIVNSKNQEIKFVGDYVTGRPICVIDSNQGIQRIVYDSLGRISEIYGPLDESNPRISYDYSYSLTRNPKTQYVSIKHQIEPGNTQNLLTKNYIDGFGRTWKTEKQAPDNKIRIDEFAYDWNGLGSKSYLPRFSTGVQSAARVCVYDLWKRPLTITEPDGKVTKYTYDGLKTTITDANQHVTRQYQDAFGRLIKVEQDNDDGTYTTTYEYDALGRVTQIWDANYNSNVANSKPIINSYDSLGRVIATSDPYNGDVTYCYDLVGNLLSKTDAKGNILQYEYDELNRLIKKSVIASGTLKATVLAQYNYDETTSQNGIGRLTSTFIGETTRASQYDYDLDGNIISSNQTINGRSYSVNYEYDSLKRLKRLTYPDSYSINYTYDAAVLNTVGDFATYANWNAAGMPQTITFGNGTITSSAYDEKTLRLTNLDTQAPNNTVIQSFGYSYDNIGNVLKVADNVPLSTMHTQFTTQTFTYDKLNRLKKSSVFGEYGYDRVGNIIAKENVTFSYSDANHPYCPTSGSNGYQAEYDANGNLRLKRDKDDIYWRYEYNAENMLLAVYRGQEAGKEYLIEEYFYDANGMRSQKNTYDGAIVKTTHYIHLGNNVLYETTGSETTRYILAGNREIAKITAGKTYYTHRDHLGSSSVVTDSSGKAVNWNANHPYGENWQISPSGTADLDKHRFTGKETDGSTGLIYFGARFYDPEVGRFLTTDTYTNLPNDERILLGKSEIGKILRIGFNDSQQYNQYSYCQNNPVNRYDPDGHFAFVPVLVYVTPVVIVAAKTAVSVTIGAMLGKAIADGRNNTGTVERTLGQKWQDFINNRENWQKVKETAEPGKVKDTTSYERTHKNQKTGETIHTHEIKNDTTGKVTHKEHPREYSKGKEEK